VDNRHFVTGNFKSHATYLSDEDYAKVLDNVVIACVDCILVNKDGEMLLGKRTFEPQPDWWIVGGRMQPGESFELAATRILKRELSLAIAPSRFHYLATYSFVWARRAESPQENGSHTISIIMVAQLKDAEIAKITPNKEHEKLQWIQPKKVLRETSFHPGLRKYARDLINYTR